MSARQVDSQLSQIEAQLALLSAALIRNDPSEMLELSAQLQSVTTAFLKFFQPMAISFKNNRPLALRIKKISATIGSLREGLSRYSVRIDRTLAALMPATQNNTYSPKSGVYARQPYGSAGRQSGEFTSLSA
jgi:hypothetical protein